MRPRELRWSPAVAGAGDALGVAEEDRGARGVVPVLGAET